MKNLNETLREFFDENGIKIDFVDLGIRSNAFDEGATHPAWLTVIQTEFAYMSFTLFTDGEYPSEIDVVKALELNDPGDFGDFIEEDGCCINDTISYQLANMRYDSVYSQYVQTRSTFSWKQLDWLREFKADYAL